MKIDIINLFKNNTLNIKDEKSSQIILRDLCEKIRTNKNHFEFIKRINEWENLNNKLFDPFKKTNPLNYNLKSFNFLDLAIENNNIECLNFFVNRMLEKKEQIKDISYCYNKIVLNDNIEIFEYLYNKIKTDTNLYKYFFENKLDYKNSYDFSFMPTYLINSNAFPQKIFNFLRKKENDKVLYCVNSVSNNSDGFLKKVLNPSSCSDENIFKENAEYFLNAYIDDLKINNTQKKHNYKVKKMVELLFYFFNKNEIFKEKDVFYINKKMGNFLFVFQDQMEKEKYFIPKRLASSFVFAPDVFKNHIKDKVPLINLLSLFNQSELVDTMCKNEYFSKQYQEFSSKYPLFLLFSDNSKNFKKTLKNNQENKDIYALVASIHKELFYKKNKRGISMKMISDVVDLVKNDELNLIDKKISEKNGEYVYFSNWLSSKCGPEDQSLIEVKMIQCKNKVVNKSSFKKRL